MHIFYSNNIQENSKFGDDVETFYAGHIFSLITNAPNY